MSAPIIQEEVIIEYPQVNVIFPQVDVKLNYPVIVDPYIEMRSPLVFFEPPIQVKMNTQSVYVNQSN